MLHFCFDFLAETKSTVAISCPFYEMEKSIPKCHSENKAYNENLKEFVDFQEDWELPINGHLSKFSKIVSKQKDDIDQENFKEVITDFCLIGGALFTFVSISVGHLFRTFEGED